MKWSETHAGVINAASQRFWVAVGNRADTVAIRMNTDPVFVAQLAAFAVNPDSEEKLLERLSSIAVPAVKHFVAAEKFCPGETIDGVKIGWLGDNFKKHLLSKIESSKVAAEELAVNKLLKNSRDPAIISALGGEEKAEISLGQFWEFLKTADQNLWYVGYIRDDEGVLWAVGARWGSDGLYVGACSLGYPDGWSTGGRFLSR